jgi:N-acetylmuramoyl-L-alanine amidase
MPADRLVRELQAKGLPAFIVYDDGLYKVRVGAFLNMDYAVRMERTLRNLGYPTVLVKERAVY